MKYKFPRIKEENIIHYFGENSIIYNKYDEINVFSEPQTDILKLCNGTMNLEEIHGEISKIYGLNSEEKDQVIKTINTFIENMTNVGLVEYGNKSMESVISTTGEVLKYYPYNLNIELTSLCNLECSHCFKSANNKSGKFIELEDIKYLVEKLKGKTHKVMVSGGEPLIHPNINEVLGLLVENFEVSLITNGTNIDRVNDDILKKVYFPQISLYGIDEGEFESITKRPSEFEKFKLGTKKLSNINKRLGLSLVLNQERKNKLEQYVQFAIDYGIRKMTFGTPLPIGRAAGSEKNRHNWSLNHNDIININKDLKYLKDKYKDKIILSTLDELFDKSKQEYWLSFFEENYEHSFSCGAGITSLTVTANGNIKPCETMPEEYFKMGSLSDLDSIINRKEIKGLKKEASVYGESLKNNNIDPSKICGKLNRLIKISGDN